MAGDLNPDYVSRDELETKYDSLPASMIVGGKTTSVNGRMEIDLDTGLLTFFQGKFVKARLGKFQDGKFGLRVYDNNGKIVVDSTA